MKTGVRRLLHRLPFSVPLLAVVLGGSIALAQAGEAAFPRVSFGLDFPGSQPERYAIVIPANGEGTYHSDGKLTPDGANDEFRITFSVSEGLRKRVFDLAKQAHYFDGDVDSHKKNLAFTGAKTLTYEDGQKRSKASYNYSSVSPVQQLTDAFEGLSTTLEFGRRLDYYHHYQKLALDDELKRMEELNKQDSLVELSAIATALEQIVNDNSLINPVRARAQRLLLQAASPAKK